MPDDPLVAVLAAGRGRRFGGSKLEIACAGRPLGRWALDAVAAAGLGPGLIVTGPEGVSFAPEWTVLVNPDPAAGGLGSSLALAARHAMARHAGRLLVLLADMPLVDPGHLRRLVRAPAPSATRQPDGRAGVPAVLDPGLVERATRLSGDRGAGPLLVGATVLDAASGILADVDRPQDLAIVERVLRQAQDQRA